MVNPGKRCALLLLFSAWPAAAQFTPANGSPFSSLSPVAAVSGDFNLDGVPDLAIATGNNFVQIFLGNPDGTFGASFQIINAGKNPTAIAAGDLNRDGYLDLVVTYSGLNDAGVLYGNGTGSFADLQPNPLVPAGKNPGAVAIGDFNHDGFEDLAIVNTGDNTVSVLLGNGGITFMAMHGSPFSVGAGAQSIALGDFNGDGWMDLAVPNLTDNTVTILLNSAGAGFAKATGSPFGAGNGPSAVVAGDFNQDGKLDLAIADSLGNNVTILLGDGSGGFAPSSASPIAAGSSPAAIAIGDFNGDGKRDLAVANSGAKTVSILGGNGSGGFSLLGSFATGTFPDALAVADFNGDGEPDLAIGNGVTSNFTILLNSQLYLHVSPASISIDAAQGQNPAAIGVQIQSQGEAAVPYTFTSNQSWLSISPPSGSTPGFFLSHPVVAFTSASESVAANIAGLAPGNYFGVLRAASTGYFGAALAVTLATWNAAGAFTVDIDNTFPSNLGPALDGPSIVLADFNGDGILDIAYTNDGLNNLVVMLGTGGGHYSQANGSPISTGNLPRNLVAGDFNNDGRVDLAYDNVNGGTLQILFGDGKGGFRTGQLIGVSTDALVTGDFNHDGLLDLAALDYTNSVVTPLLNIGDGNFSPQPSDATGKNPNALLTGDFTGDGILDLLVANTTDQTLSILRGTGAGQFSSLTPVALTGYPEAIAVGDFNGDGIPDLAAVVTNGANYLLAVFLNDGFGGFNAVTGTPAPVSVIPNALAVGDFNGDGKLDVAVEGFGAEVLLGDGTGKFTPQSGKFSSAGDRSGALAVADFNADGRLDLFMEGSGNTAQFLLGGLAPTTTTLQATSGAAVTMTVTVANTAPAFGTPSGTVSLYDGITLLNSVPLSAAGTLTYPPALAPGVHTLLAVYNGDSRSSGSTSSTVTVTQLPGNPVLSITKSHSGNFTQGQTNATYTVTVSNGSGDGVTSGAVTVAESLPTGLSLVSMAGSGWTCTGGSCTRTNSLSSGLPYPAIAVTVNVAANAPASVTNQVTVSGGGSGTASAWDVTTITAFSPCDANQDGKTNVADVQSVINQALGVATAKSDLNHDGVVNVADVQIVINAALGLGCTAS